MKRALSNGSSGNGASELLRCYAFFFFFLLRLLRDDITVLVSKAVEAPLLPAKKSADALSARGVVNRGYNCLYVVIFL